MSACRPAGRSASPARAGLLVALAAGLACGCGLPRWPVDAPLLSPFGVRMSGLRPTLHRGVDLDVPFGTPVHAMAEARVRFAGVMRGFGNVIWLDHGGQILSIYAHLSEILVTEGGAVRAGEVVGLSGASGNATAPHLHFEVWRWGREVDPVPLLGGFPGR